MLYKGTPKYCIIQYISKEFLMYSVPAENPRGSCLLQANGGSRHLTDRLITIAVGMKAC